VKNHAPKASFLPWLLLIAIGLIWGTSFILIKKGLQVFSPGELGALRITMAFLALSPVALVNLRKLPRQKIPLLFLLGMVGSFVPAFLFAIAQTRLDSAITGVINAITPIFVALIGLVFFQQKIKTTNAAGIAMGFIGTVVLLLGGAGFDISGVNYYALFVVAATLMYGTNVNLIKQYTPNIKALHITAVSLFLTSPFCLFYLFGMTGFLDKVSTDWVFWRAFLFVSILGVVGTAGALILFNKLIQISSTVFASSVTYLIPLVAIVWGVVDGESINVYQYLGMAVVLCGVWLANKKGR
jgi:drug/metabolite transporter (DMT)-like permease